MLQRDADEFEETLAQQRQDDIRQQQEQEQEYQQVKAHSVSHLSSHCCMRRSIARYTQRYLHCHQLPAARLMPDVACELGP